MSGKTNEFHVSLQGLNISPDVAKRIEVEIRQVVLKEVAGMDLKGDLVIENLPKQEALTTSLGSTRGIVARVQ